jgi:hypothetical protein
MTVTNVLWSTTPCGLVESYDVSEEPAASEFRSGDKSGSVPVLPPICLCGIHGGLTFTMFFITHYGGRDSVVGIATGYWLECWGFESQLGPVIFLFYTRLDHPWGPTQAPIQWVSGTLCWR